VTTGTDVLEQSASN